MTKERGFNLARIGRGRAVHLAHKPGSRAICGANQGRKLRSAGAVVGEYRGDTATVTCAGCRVHADRMQPITPKAVTAKPRDVGAVKLTSAQRTLLQAVSDNEGVGTRAGVSLRKLRDLGLIVWDGRPAAASGRAGSRSAWYVTEAGADWLRRTAAALGGKHVPAKPREAKPRKLARVAKAKAADPDTVARKAFAEAPRGAARAVAAIVTALPPRAYDLFLRKIETSGVAPGNDAAHLAHVCRTLVRAAPGNARVVAAVLASDPNAAGKAAHAVLAAALAEAGETAPAPSVADAARRITTRRGLVPVGH